MPDTRSSSGAPSLNFPGGNPANAEAERAGSEEPEVHIPEATATLSNDVAAMTQAIAQQAQQFKDALTKSERDKENLKKASLQSQDKQKSEITETKQM